MDWLNVKSSFLRSAEFLGSEMDARGTWLSVAGYCIEQENNGRIVGAASWDDRQWLRAAGVTADEIKQAYPLITTAGEDVLLLGYPSDQQSEVEAKRRAARSTNAKRYASGSLFPRSATRSASTERGGSDEKATSLTPSVKEGKEREGKGSDTLTFFAELFIQSHPSCVACDTTDVENILRGYSRQEVQEAIEAFSKQWAGAEFPRTSPPLKEFSKYLRFAAKKKGAPAGEAVAVAEGPVAFKGRSADDEPPAPRSLTRGSKP